MITNTVCLTFETLNVKNVKIETIKNVKFETGKTNLLEGIVGLAFGLYNILNDLSRSSLSGHVNFRVFSIQCH